MEPPSTESSLWIRTLAYAAGRSEFVAASRQRRTCRFGGVLVAVLP
jgi:hypothetical protein